MALQALAAADITLFLPHKDPAQYVKSLSPYLKVWTVWFGQCGLKGGPGEDRVSLLLNYCKAYLPFSCNAHSHPIPSPHLPL